MRKKQTFALMSVGLLLGYYMTRTVKVGMIIVLVAAGFAAGVAVEQYLPEVMR